MTGQTKPFADSRTQAIFARGHYTLDNVLEELQAWREYYGGEKRVRGNFRLYTKNHDVVETIEKTWPYKVNKG